MDRRMWKSGWMMSGLVLAAIGCGAPATPPKEEAPVSIDLGAPASGEAPAEKAADPTPVLPIPDEAPAGAAPAAAPEVKPIPEEAAAPAANQ